MTVTVTRRMMATNLPCPCHGGEEEEEEEEEFFTTQIANEEAQSPIESEGKGVSG
jgi:hypothetical protein